MTNPNLTLIGILVDRSASMFSMKDEMDLALKTFLDANRDLPGECQVTLAQFDTVYERVYSPRDIREVPDYHIQPRGGTALYDAMARFIDEIGVSLRQQPESQRPGKVIIVTITDGEENSSRKYRLYQVNDRVTRQTETYNWEFVFLGANIDAVAVAESLGISRGSSITFDAAEAPIAMAAASNYVTSYRTTGAAQFTEDDRKKAMGA